MLCGLVAVVGCTPQTSDVAWPDRPTPPVVVASTTTTPGTADASDDASPTSVREQIIADFSAAIEERQRCGRAPQRCVIQRITARSSEYRAFLTALMAERAAAGFRTVEGIGDFRFRIESVELTDVDAAVVHTCSRDSVVLFDLGHGDDTTDVTTRPIIVDDSIVSARTRWELTFEDGRWKWVLARGMERNMEEDLCGFGM
ncbi:MAG: hypothetical protein ACKOQZ_02550 [Actinomycetota bacterium]